MKHPATENTPESFKALLAYGDILQCPGCGAYNAYAYQDVNMDVNTGLRIKAEDGYKDGGELYTDDELLTNWPDVYHIPAASGFEWQCRNCGSDWTPIDSPINSPCYTHSED
jgi:hypothetical protein